MRNQTFIFCLGATKAGTSWLFDYLSGHRQCHLPAMKELHYFDALEQGTGGYYRKQAQARLDAARKDQSSAWQKRLMADLERWLSVFDGETRDDAAYLRYLREGGAKARVIGDFTPAYGLLKEKTLQAMSALTDNVRFVYLMRDPVDRIWSNIRMMAGNDGQAALDAKVDGVLNGTAENILDRSNYRRTLNRLTRAIPREALHIEFYEQLFTPAAIERLCAFLGITPQPASFDRVVHQSVKADLPTGQRAQLQAALKPQYNFVEKFMGELPPEWTQKMVSA
ncbi:sulfotransferase [Aliiroseovarius sediminis]|uniref:sulfotransferase family protein n=1 Tax=Aliiroseovarius sediminis TaxID=2925839 RepID=UPI001F57D7F4|nr:sulfotransferase [Aliiroseovarius sediminis]MCI2393022.1 sulfotransferase [Aliiroseovarius sediminis]